MCHQVALRLPCDATSARRARDFVTAQCAEWHIDALRGDLALPISELVTNALLHAQTDVTLTATLSSGYVEVSVRDTDPRPPVLRPARADIDTDIRVAAARSAGFPEDLRHDEFHVGAAGSIAAGRGLHIVDAIADEWGVSALAGGKEVWFRLLVPVSQRRAIHCPCGPSRVRTPGGLPYAALAG